MRLSVLQSPLFETCTIDVWYFVSKLDHCEALWQMRNENSDQEIPEANITLYKVDHVKLWSITMIDDSSS